MKTLGLSNSSIKKSFFLTGFTIGLFATISGTIIGVLFSHYIENIRNFLSMVFKINIFPSDVYFLEQMPSQIDFLSAFFYFPIIITNNLDGILFSSHCYIKNEYDTSIKI